MHRTFTKIKTSAEYEAKALVGSDSINLLKRNGLVVVTESELEILMSGFAITNEQATKELLAAGFSEKQLQEQEKQIKVLVKIFNLTGGEIL